MLLIFFIRGKIKKKKRWRWKRWCVRSQSEEFNLVHQFPKLYLLSLIFFSNSSFGTKLIFYYFQIPGLWRKIEHRWISVRRRLWFSSISTTKMVELVVHEFYLMKRVWWCFFKTSILPKQNVDPNWRRKI